jgi:hypothetical protein
MFAATERHAVQAGFLACDDTTPATPARDCSPRRQRLHVHLQMQGRSARARLQLRGVPLVQQHARRGQRHGLDARQRGPYRTPRARRLRAIAATWSGARPTARRNQAAGDGRAGA